MSEEELRWWWESRKGSGDDVAEAVGRLFQKYDALLGRAPGPPILDIALCAGWGHYFPGGAWKCQCERYTREQFEIADFYSTRAHEPPKEKMKFTDISAEPISPMLKGTSLPLDKDVTEPIHGVEWRDNSCRFDGSTGLPENKKAGRPAPAPPGQQG